MACNFHHCIKKKKKNKQTVMLHGPWRSQDRTLGTTVQKRILLGTFSERKNTLRATPEQLIK